MKKPERVESRRGLERLQREIDAFAGATGTLPRIEAFIRATKRLRAVAARATGVSARSEQPEKDICYLLEWVVNATLWTEMWQGERSLLAGTKPAQTQDMLRKFPMYLNEMRRSYPQLAHIVAADEERARARASADKERSLACHTRPKDPGRRGPRIDFSIEQIDETSMDREERTLRVRSDGMGLSEARKLKEALLGLPFITAVQMSDTQGWRRKGRYNIPDWQRDVTYSVRTTLTAADLARVVTNGLCGMVFDILTFNDKSIVISKR